MKKLISFSLVLCLLLSLVPISASADDNIKYGDMEFEVIDEDNLKLIEYTGTEAEVTIPNYVNDHRVTAVGAYAFRDNEYVRSVYIPDSVSWIASGCLGPNCQSVVLPGYIENASSLRINTFSMTLTNGKVVEMSLPNLTIYAFSGASSDAVKVAQNAVSSNGHVALAKYDVINIDDDYSDGYTEPEISITSFTNYSGDGKKVTDVYIPDSFDESKVTGLGSNCFFNSSNSNNITNIKLPSELRVIKSCALAGNKLTSVDLPDSVIMIGSDAFDFNELNGIYIPFDAELQDTPFAFNVYPFTIRGYYGSDAYRYYLEDYNYCEQNGFSHSFFFEPLSDFEFAPSSDGYAVKGYKGTDSDIELPSELCGKPITEIASNAFFLNKNLTSVIFPPSIKRIGSGAFTACTNITMIASSDFPIVTNALYYVEEIGQNAFISCNKLSMSDLCLNADSIGDAAFYDVKLSSVTIYNRDASIGRNAFGYLDNHQETGGLKNTSFVVKGFNSSTAKTYASLNGFTFKPLDSSAYTYTISNNAATITSYNLNEMNVTVPEKLGGARVKYIDSDAFYAKRLKSLSLPNTILSIGDNAFAYCKNLRDVEIYKTAAYQKPALMNIGDGAFKNCRELETLELSDFDNLKTIGTKAFLNCVNYRPIGWWIGSLPVSLTSIGDYAFLGCRVYYYQAFNRNITIGKCAIGFRYDENNNIVRTDTSDDPGLQPVTIYGFNRSTAQKYANDSHLNFRLYDYYGDVNLDGKINITDVTLTQKAIAKLVKLNSEQARNADIDTNGVVNIKDATKIQKYIAKQITIYDLFEPKG